MVVAAATVMAQAIPSAHSALRRFSRRQRPPGTRPTARRPRGARACVGVIAVSTPLSSRNTSLSGATLAHTSGFVAVYLCGLVLGNAPLPHRSASLGFAERTGTARLSAATLCRALARQGLPRKQRRCTRASRSARTS